MTAYRINTLDVCSSGFERLRSNSEFLIVAEVVHGVTQKDLLAMLLADVQCCDRPDGFDYHSCNNAIIDCIETSVAPFYAKNSLNPFDVPEDSDCRLFLYMQAVETADAE